MTRIYFQLLLIISLAMVSIAPTVSAGTPLSALEAATIQVHGSADRPTTKDIPSALENGAYFSVIALTGEHHAGQEAERLWDEAQAAPNPAERYMQSVHETTVEAKKSLEDSLQVLLEFTSPSISLNRLEFLVLAGHVLAQGESDLRLALAYLGSTPTPQSLSSSQARYTVLEPAIQAQMHADVAADLLAAVPANGGGPEVSTHVLSSRLAGAVTTDWWPLESHGPIHDLARNVREFSMSQPNATVSELAAAMARLDGVLAQGGAGSSVMQAVKGDATWWLERAPAEPPETWRPVLTFQASQAAAAAYQHELLEHAIEDDFPWTLALLVTGGILLASALMILAHRKSHAQQALLVMLVAALVLASPIVTPGAEAGDGTSNEPVDVSDPAGGLGNAAVDANGVLHLVWASCPSEGEGCSDIHYRTHDPGTGGWTHPSKVVDPAHNATLPRVALLGTTAHLFWLEGDSSSAGTPRELHHCVLEGGSCGAITRLSTPGEYTVIAEAAAGPADLVAVWHEEYSHGSAIRTAWFRDGGWGTIQDISDPARLSRYPDVALDPARGTAHVVWQGGLDTDKNIVDREVTYAAITAGGVVEGPRTVADSLIDAHVRPAITLRHDGTLGIAFNAWRDVFFVERPLNAPEFGDAINMSRSERSSESFPEIAAVGDEWIVTWTKGGVGQMSLWKAMTLDGYWTRPAVMVGEPYGTYILLPRAVAVDDRFHIVWTGSATGHPSGPWGLFYLTTSIETGSAYAPPEITSVKPQADTWLQGPTITLEAVAATDAPLSEAHTYWTLGGESLETKVSSGGRITAHALPAEGPHSAEIVVQDTQGGEARRTVTFHVDTTPPGLEATVTAGGTPLDDPTGWYSSPVHVDAAADAGAGAPARVEVDSHQRGLWTNLTEGGLDLAEGALVPIRLRAIDEAGNTEVGPLMELGWDATPPNITLAAPQWSQGEVLVNATDSAGIGSPIAASIHAVGPSPQWVNATIPANGSWETSLAGLLQGNYTLHSNFTDSAGNTQQGAPIQVTIDTERPAIRFVDGTLLVEDSGGSGLASLLVDSEEQPLVPGAQNATLSLPQTGTTVEVVATDRAGNVREATLDPEALALHEADPGDEADGQGQRKTTKEDNPLPGPTAVVAIVSLLVGTAMARRSRFSKNP